MYADTYFLNAKEALRVASEQNRFGDMDVKYNLQCCYYDGEKIESNLPNLFHLPIENLLDGLIHDRHRIPSKIDFTGLNISYKVQVEILTHFNMTIEQAKKYRIQRNLKDLNKWKSLKLNFNEPLRFYLMANNITTVIQFVSKNIAQALEDRGCIVMYDLYKGTEDISSFNRLYKYNPHVMININNINNKFLGKDVFNFIWFQDPMPILFNNEPILKRGRDYIFTYQTAYKNSLILKGIDEQKILEQKVIPVNTHNFYLNKDIVKENKIIFVGSFYEDQFENYLTDELKIKIEALIEEGKTLTIKNLETIFPFDFKNLPDADHFIMYIQQSFTRNICVKWLSEYSNKKVEIYGYRWEESNNKNIIYKFNGKVNPSNLNTLYNSAKYILSASGQVINTQRLGEIVHAGAIPVIYDSRDMTDEEETWDEECLYFKTQKELNYILDNNIEPAKYRDAKMLSYFTYDNFIKTIFEKIDNNLRGTNVR